MNSQSITAADLLPGHILIENGRPALVEGVFRNDEGLAVIEQSGGRPRKTTIRALQPDQATIVTAQSHAYVTSHQREQDKEKARLIVQEHKALLRPHAGELAKGAAVSLRPLADSLREAGHTEDARTLDRLPGLRVQVDPKDGLVLTESPSGLTRGAAQTWRTIEGEARALKLAAFADPASPPGVLMMRFRSRETGEDVGLQAKVDLKSGSAQIGRAHDVDQAHPTLDTSRMKTDLGAGWRQTVKLAQENGSLRPDLPRSVASPRDRLVQVEDRESISGKFKGIAASANPDRMLVSVASLNPPGIDRVSVPKESLFQLPEHLREGSPIKITYSAQRGVELRASREKEKAGSSGREIGLSL